MDETTTPAVKKKFPWLLAAVVVLFLLGSGFVLYQNNKASTGQNTNTAVNPTAVTQPTTPVTTQTAVKTFTVTGQNYSFSPDVIRVKKGDRVKITFTNKEGFHDFVLDDFNVRTNKIGTGQSDTVEFTADKTGTFEYYCSVANHRQMGMKGNLIVE